MDAGSIYLASSAATVINVFCFAIMWRGHRIEMTTGKDPWWMGATLVVYALSVAAFLYIYRKTPITTGPELFMATLCGQAVGIFLTFAIAQAVWPTKNSIWPNRSVPAIAALILGGLIVVGLLG